MKIIEARSLSTLIDLAENPPLNPRGHSQERSESATAEEDELKQVALYIARVPGSRDLFLTTIKPRDKVVSEVDVGSCFYYLHWEDSQSPEGPGLSRTGESLPEEPGDFQEQSHAAIHRKPLPSHDGGSELTSNDEVMSCEKPRVDSRTAKVEDVLRRKPLGPRAIPSDSLQNEQETHTDHFAPLPDLDGRSNREDHFKSELISPGGLRKAPIDTKSHFYTIIRRDPASGAQVNIGSINGFQSEESEGIPSSTNVIINNPGYSKITGTDEFQCRITNEGSSSSNNNRRKKSITSEIENRVRSSPSSMGQRRASRQNGFTFTTPWGGTCNFVTGAGGRNLKCEHYLHEDVDSPSSSFSAATILSDLRLNIPGSKLFRSSKPHSSEHESGESTHSKGAASIFSKETLFQHYRTRGRNHHQHHYSRSFPGEDTSKNNSFDERFPPRQNEKENGVEYMNLALGQEKAGGGSGGKNAKLGKVVVLPEGLKMLDLTVAANMAVFLRLYEPRS